LKFIGTNNYFFYLQIATMSQLPRVLSSLPTVQTDEYKYTCPKTGVHVYQQPWKFYPVDNNNYKGRGQNRIRFEIPNSCIFNFTTGYLSFYLTLSTDGIVQLPSTDPAYVRLGNGSWEIAQRMRHLDNLQPIEEIFPYNLIFSFKWVFMQNQPYAQNVGPDLLGIGTTAQRNAWGALTKKYVIPIDLNWIRAGPFPAKYMRNAQSIEIYLEDPSVCMETNCGSPNYTVSNCEMHCYKMLPGFPGVENAIQGMAWEESIKRDIQSGQYRVMIDWWDWYQNTPLAIQGDYLIPIKTACIKGIYTVFGNVNNVGNTQINGKMMSYPKLSLNQYYLKIFSCLFPEQPVDCTDNAIEAYMFYLTWINTWKINSFPTGDQPTFPNAITDVPISLDNFNNTKFCAFADFRSTRYRDCINPILNTDTSTTDTRIYLRFDSTPPTGSCAYHFAESSAIIGLTPDGDTYAQLN